MRLRTGFMIRFSYYPVYRRLMWRYVSDRMEVRMPMDRTGRTMHRMLQELNR